MIIRTIQGDVFKSTHKTIVFAINTEGYNDSGFAGMVARRFDWASLMQAGETPLGTILTLNTCGYTFYAICCHSLKGEWNTDIITTALDTLPTSKHGDEPAVVWMGHGLIGTIQGVDPRVTRAAIEASKTPCYLCHL